MEYKCLPNGFQVIYEKPPSSLPITSICVICKLGSASEPAHLKGVSHLIEHLCFKGTINTPNTKSFLEEFSMLGVEHSAFTNQEAVWFRIKCQDNHLEKCIKLLSESILSSQFSFENFKKEEDVIHEENRKDEDNPNFIISINTVGLLFENTPFQQPVDHTCYHKTKFNYKEVYKYYKETYVPSNLYLSITTNTSFNNVLKYIKKTEFAKNEKFMSNQMRIVPQQLGFDYKIIQKKELKSVLLNIAFRTCDYYNTDSYILNLLIFVLGNGLNGRLVNTLRQKYGLVYYINASAEYNFLGGFLNISTQCDAQSLMNKSPSVLPLIIKELRMLLKGITQKELTMAKNNKKEEILFALEDSHTLSWYNGWSLLYYKPELVVPYSKVYKTYIENITLQDVNDCIKKYFRLDRMCFVVLGNNLPSTNAMLSQCLEL